MCRGGWCAKIFLLRVSEKVGGLSESLLNRLVTVRVGRALSRDSIGCYYYELRSVVSP